MTDDENNDDAESDIGSDEEPTRKGKRGAPLQNDFAKGNSGGGAPIGNDNGRGNSGGGAPKGNTNGSFNTSGGAPAFNQNAQKHALFSSHDGYYHDLDEQGKEWVAGFLEDLLDRYRDVHGEEPDRFDREALKNIAIDFHRVAKANSWFAKEGLTHEEKIISEDYTKVETKLTVWASEIRRYNESVSRRMQKHGLLRDPESKKAEG
jgi:uncharacterized protein YjcR